MLLLYHVYVYSFLYSFRFSHIIIRQRTCASARAPGVTLKDIVQPERIKTMNILSALINLVKFTEEQQEFVINLREQSINAAEERDRLESEIIQMREQINLVK